MNSQLSKSKYILAYSLLVTALMVSLLAMPALARPSALSGTKTICPSGCNYATLTDAIIDIGVQGGLDGALVLELQSTYVSTGETFPITFGTFTGSSAVNTVTVRPAADATGLTISGSNAGATVELNGATYVILDGRPGGAGTAKELTVENTSTSGQAVKFIDGASYNTLQYLTIKGVTTSTSSGVVWFSTSTAATGNNNNTIDHCELRDGATTPTNLIDAYGTSGKNNTNNVISNNNIYNFHNPGSGATNGVYIGAYNAAWTISGNSFYQTSARTPPGDWHAIQINSTTGAGGGYTITDNVFGGSAPNAGGSAMSLTMTGVFRGAIRASTDTAVANSIQGNTIKNIAITSSSASNANALISLMGGAFNVGTTTSNTLGSQSDTGSITFSSSGAATFSGIAVPTGGTLGAIAIQNNTIGSISVSGAGAVSFRGIHVQGGNPEVTISNNTIGSPTVANSLSSSTNAAFHGIYTVGAILSSVVSNNTIANLSATGASTGNRLVGIYMGGSTTSTITGNTVRNLASASTSTGTGTTSAVIGISVLSTGSPTGSLDQTISQNIVHSLSNSDGSASVSLIGIAYNGPASGANLVERNFVHNFELSTSSTGAAITGMYIAGGLTTYQNNMVQVGHAPDGTDIASDYNLNGIYNNGGANNFYFNTVYVGGAGVSASSNNTTALYRATTSTEEYKDNILVNARSNSDGTGKHYAFLAVDGTGMTSDYNLLYAPGTGGYIGGVGANDYQTFANWQGAGYDANSLSADPILILPDGSSSTTDLHVSTTDLTPIEGQGVDIPSVIDDYDGDVRASFTPVDIGADARNLVANVTFVYHDLEDVVQVGEQVALAGGFNSWNTSANIMTGDAGATTFTATLALSPGNTYGYKYIVKSSGDQWDWLQTSDRSLTVSVSQTIHDYRNVAVGWANLQWPTSLTIQLGNATGNIYGQVYIQNVTNPAGDGRGIKAELGFGTDAAPGNWTWSEMSFNVNDGNNDEFMGDFTPTLTGVYSYTTRYDGNWGVGNPNAGWTYGDTNGTPPFSIHDVGVLTVEQPQYTLTMSVVGSGSTIPTVGDHSYVGGTEVLLTASADPGWTFAGWSGDVITTTNPVSITMDAQKAITATFTQDEYTLTVITVGGGAVSKNPDQATYYYGDVVTVTATADPGWVFSGWSGDLSGSTNPDTITMDGNKSVTATFIQYYNYFPLVLNDDGGMARLLPDVQAKPGASLAWISFLFLVGLAFQKFYGQLLRS